MARHLVAGMNVSFDVYHQLDSLAAALKERQKTQKPDAASVQNVEKQIKAIQDGTHDAPGMGSINRDLSRLLNSVEAADERPTEPQTQAVTETCGSLDKALGLWNALNDGLRTNNPLDLPIAPSVSGPGCTE
jgi:hypothetical protein